MKHALNLTFIFVCLLFGLNGLFLASAYFLSLNFIGPATIVLSVTSLILSILSIKKPMTKLRRSLLIAFALFGFLVGSFYSGKLYRQQASERGKLDF